MDTENDKPWKSLGKGVFPFKYCMSILEYFCWKFRLVIPGYPGSAVETEFSGRCLRRGFKVQAFRESEQGARKS